MSRSRFVGMARRKLAANFSPQRTRLEASLAKYIVSRGTLMADGPLLEHNQSTAERLDERVGRRPR